MVWRFRLLSNQCCIDGGAGGHTGAGLSLDRPLLSCLELLDAARVDARAARNMETSIIHPSINQRSSMGRAQQARSPRLVACRSPRPDNDLLPCNQLDARLPGALLLLTPRTPHRTGPAVGQGWHRRYRLSYRSRAHDDRRPSGRHRSHRITPHEDRRHTEPRAEPFVLHRPPLHQPHARTHGPTPHPQPARIHALHAGASARTGLTATAHCVALAGPV